MTAQYPFGSPNDRYRKKLFVDTGYTYKEVEARIIEPYSPPTPQPNFKEIKLINAPSHIHQMGLSSYKVTINLLFNDKQAYNDYLIYCGWTHKFYDEMGHMFLGSISNVKPAVFEASNRYKVEIELVCIKKDTYDQKHRFEYQDINGHWAQTDIEELADMGLLSVISRDGTPDLYFRPEEYMTRAEFVTLLNRTRRFMERIIRE